MDILLLLFLCGNVHTAVHVTNSLLYFKLCIDYSSDCGYLIEICIFITIYSYSLHFSHFLSII